MARVTRYWPLGTAAALVVSVMLAGSSSATASAIGQAGFVVSLLGVLAYASASVLREILPRCQPVPDSLHDEVARLSRLADTPMPRIRVVKDIAYNGHPRSFRGRDRITVTSAALARPATALTGLLAHELAHIINGDIRLFRRVIVPMTVLVVAGRFALANAGFPPEHAHAADLLLLLAWLAFVFQIVKRTELRAEHVATSLVGPNPLLASLAEVKTHRLVELACWLLWLPTMAQRRAVIERAANASRTPPAPGT
ncbi:MAG: M48 family metalloprotease [Solirubrobacteraceae bacterium]|nr:M48 family metalloprotease [Solirubrobacteraceae bacterium]